jgi:uncharacterized radical SAM superfamily protein
MLDIIGAQDTISQVYHLQRRVEDFETALASLVHTSMRVVPHIVLGLHYGKFLGEWNALDLIHRHTPDALVLVVVMPFYASTKRPFAEIDSAQVGRFFFEARRRFPSIPISLGCARPPGTKKTEIDIYALLAGLDAIAHPAEGLVELAGRLNKQVEVSAACCSTPYVG